MSKAEELAKQISGIQPRTRLAEAMLKKHTEAINEYAQQESRDEIIKDRMAILEDLATRMWYTEEEIKSISEASEDYDLAYGYDDNGHPNSVSLIIYGRTHSDYKIPDFNHQNNQ